MLRFETIETRNLTTNPQVTSTQRATFAVCGPDLRDGSARRHTSIRSVACGKAAGQHYPPLRCSGVVRYQRGLWCCGPVHTSGTDSACAASRIDYPIQDTQTFQSTMTVTYRRYLPAQSTCDARH
eukprot:1162343-Rhodomonas_salina.1